MEKFYKNMDHNQSCYKEYLALTIDKAKSLLRLVDQIDIATLKIKCSNEPISLDLLDKYENLDFRAKIDGFENVLDNSQDIKQIQEADSALYELCFDMETLLMISKKHNTTA